MFCSLTTLSRSLFFALLSLGTLCASAFASNLIVPSQYATIQAAVNAAASGDTVLIADGTYTGPGNVDIDFGGKSIIVQSLNGAASTIINCGGSSNAYHRGFYLHSGETGVIINGLTIENGYEGNGGAIYSSCPGLTVEYCVISNNSAVFGGGMYNFNNNGGTESLISCIFTDNTSRSGQGGGLFSENYVAGTLKVNLCAFTGNLSPGCLGGGLYNYNSGGGTFNVTNSTFTGNTADLGGGLYDVSDSGTGTMTNCVLTGNAVNTDGGGGGQGDGIYSYVDQNGTLTVTNCTLFDNSDSTSGSIYNTNSTGGTTVLTNNIVYGDSGGEITGTGLAANNCDIMGGYTGVGNINADPKFVNSSTDLHLQASSLCLGSGTKTGAPARTIDGEIRPNPPSIGAYEVTMPALTTTTTLTANPNPSVAGQYIFFQATVAGTGATPTGTVVFTIDGATSPPVTLHSGHYAAYLAGALSVGTHTVTASYSGDTDFSPSTSPVLTQTVNPHINPQYVSLTGNDSNLGTQAAPRLTIQAAINATLNGDTVIVEDGTYTGLGDIDLDFGGNNITVTSQNGAAATIIDCQNIANHRGFYLHFGETSAVISGLTILNGNDSSGGAGIYNASKGLTIQNCVLKNNTATEANGGGIYNSGTLTVAGCTLTGNVASYSGIGGGIDNESGTLSVTNSILSGNTAANGGGGIFNNTYTAGSFTLVNCVFVGNSASSNSGGGLYNDGYYGANTVTNCTFTGNSSGYSYGGGILSYIGGGEGSTVALVNDIVYGNSGGDVSGTFTAISYCDIGIVYSGTGNINANPLFVSGTAPYILHLQSGSPCLGAGTASGAPATTIDGYTRPNPPSIGAYELAPVPAPTNLTATAGPGKVTLSWTAPAGVSGAKYNLYRGTTSGAETLYYSNIPTTNFGNSNVVAGTKYFYIVKTVLGSQLSAASNEASATPTATTGLPAAPTNLKAVAGDTKVTLTWTAPAGPVTSYSVYRGTSATTLTFYKTAGTATSFTNTYVVNGTTYYYAVAAVNSVGTGPQSTVVSATPLAVPAAPTGLTATASGGKITLNWTASTGTVSSYSVYRGTVSGGETFYKTANTSTTFVNSLVTKGTTYYYTIKALNSSGSSLASNEASATP